MDSSVRLAGAGGIFRPDNPKQEATMKANAWPKIPSELGEAERLALFNQFKILEKVDPERSAQYQEQERQIWKATILTNKIKIVISQELADSVKL
jgi:hypothetical protein